MSEHKTATEAHMEGVLQLEVLAWNAGHRAGYRTALEDAISETTDLVGTFQSEHWNNGIKTSINLMESLLKRMDEGKEEA